MLVPKLLRIEGFRGFTQAREFRFDNPATILYGQNHSGKSSTLNALEWCLFGNECSGKSTGFRERFGWIVANRHIAPPNVSVQLVLENAAGKVIIQRRLRNEKRKQVEELSVCKPDGEELRKEEAERYLAHLLRTTFRDFSTTTYQHQENIRAILTQEPKERDDAIDRLLGLSIYRNLLETMSKAKAKEAQKKLEQKFEGFEREVTAALATREQDMESLQQQAEDLGISGGQQNEEHALDLAKQLVNQLKDFARELGIEPRELEVPATWQLLGEFAASTKDLVTWLRSEMPALKEQQNLYQKELTLSKLQADLQERETEKSTISKQLFELESTYGNVESAKNQIQDLDQQLQAEQLRLRQTDAKAALIKEALEYFDLGTSSKDR